jgi:hypothetical protein
LLALQKRLATPPKTISITTLDADKAFDKLVHNILFRKLAQNVFFVS